MKILILENKPKIKLYPQEDTQYVFLPSATNNKVEIQVNLDKSGIKVEFIVPAVFRNKDEFYLKVFSNHTGKNTSSCIYIKSVLFDKASFDFEGKIIVDKNGNGTDSSLDNKVLSLGKKTKSKSKPILEINADDVAVSHGSTSADLDQEDLFYFMSRGLGKEEAISVLTKAFLDDLVNKINDEKIRNSTKEKLYEKLK